MFATAPATARRPRSSRGREMMRTTRPPVVDGLSLALQAASSDTSTSTTATIQASYAIAPDFFNGLLGPAASRLFAAGWSRCVIRMQIFSVHPFCDETIVLIAGQELPVHDRDFRPF